MKVFIFKIDTDRRFSDGSRLTAQDFKQSWEDGLKLASKVSQKSQMDVAYKIAGFKQFATTGHLSGVESIDDETLKVSFSSPFRMALDHLTGSRFAAYKVVEGRYIGTGPYKIAEHDENSISLKKNIYSQVPTGTDSVKVLALSAEETSKAIVDGTIDVYAYAGRDFYDGTCNDGAIGCMDGFEAAHVVISVNGLVGRTFSNPNFRKALQFLLTQTYNGINPQEFLPHGVLSGAALDPQPFLPLQAGRLSEKEAVSLIEAGKPFVEALVTYTQLHPISLAYRTGSMTAEPCRKLLEAHGVKFADPKIAATILELIPMMSLTAETDLAFITKSVVDGDPDGIYHALGAKGAIATPMSLRPRVSELLEEGRSIVDNTKLDAHYQNASRAILEDVPWVHLGFAREKTVYRSDRIKVNYRSIKSRIREPFSIFEPK